MEEDEAHHHHHHYHYDYHLVSYVEILQILYKSRSKAYVENLTVD